MNYQSINDLAKTIRTNLHHVPRDVDLVVGVPRSGVLASTILALNLNISCCDLNDLFNNSDLLHGRTRHLRHCNPLRPSDAKHILIIDDSIDSGDSMAEVRRAVDALGLDAKITYAAAYATTGGARHVSICLKIINQPRAFEWNLMHRPLLGKCCVDIDGVLCFDPTRAENDDGPKYRHFLKNACPLYLPSHRIGHLVSSRLEKYRKETETWLEEQGVQYGVLHLLDLPNAETRRRLNAHARFKADVYRKLEDTVLFIESEKPQAQEIAQRSGKPALAFDSQIMHMPGISYARAQQIKKGLSNRVQRRIKNLVTKLQRNG